MKTNHKREISRENLQKLKKSSKEFKEDKATAGAGGVKESSHEKKKLKGDSLKNNTNNNILH